MNKSELKARFEEFTGAFFAANPLINHGGCGVFAAEMAKDLTAKGFDAKIRVVPNLWDMDGFDDIQNMFKRIKSNGGDIADLEEWEVTPYHVVVEVKGHGLHGILDAEGFEKARGYRYNGRPMAKGYVPIEVMDYAAQHSDIWNPTFPRRTIPRVRRAIKEFTEGLFNG